MEMEEHLDMQRPEQPFFLWLFQALGFRYAVCLPFLTLLALVLACLAIWKFKTPYLTAVLIAVVPLPVICGAFGVVDGLMASWQTISLSGVRVPTSQLAEGGALSLVTLQVGLLLSLPLYLLAAAALCCRAFADREAERLDKEPPVGAIYSQQG